MHSSNNNHDHSEDMATAENTDTRGRTSFSGRVMNFGMSDETWDKNLGDRYGILRLGLWSTITIVGVGVGISHYKKKQIETLISDANKNKKHE